MIIVIIIIITIQPHKALHPLVAPNLPQEVPPFFSMPAHLLHPCIPRMCNASLWTMSSHLVLGVPTDVVLIIIIIKYFQNNFNWKYCSIFGPKIVRSPGDPDCRGTTVVVFILTHQWGKASRKLLQILTLD